jgi:rare lipoprotein A
MAIQFARFGAKSLFVLGAAALLTSTAGMATIPFNVVDTINTLEESPPVVVDRQETIDETREGDAEHVGSGRASYYGHELAGNRTASGERFNPQALTAAHRTLPLGSKLKVINQSNGKSVVVRVNDRGPFHKGRVLDVSLAAARQIGMISSGTASVRMELLR